MWRGIDRASDDDINWATDVRDYTTYSATDVTDDIAYCATDVRDYITYCATDTTDNIAYCATDVTNDIAYSTTDVRDYITYCATVATDATDDSTRPVEQCSRYSRQYDTNTLRGIITYPIFCKERISKEICRRLRYYAAYNGNSVPAFGTI